MRNLGSVADFGVLRLNESTDLAVVTEVGSGAQVREGSNAGVGANDREGGIRALDLSTRTDLSVEQGGVGADDGAGLDESRTE